MYIKQPKQKKQKKRAKSNIDKHKTTPNQLTRKGQVLMSISINLNSFINVHLITPNNT